MKCELNIFSTAFYLLLSFLILLCLEGYVFGTGDQSEMLAYAAYLRDNSLFSKDFYIQSIVHEVPNERWLFSGLLALLGERLEFPVFIAFCITAMTLLICLYRIALHFLGDQYPYIAWMLALAVIIPLNGISLGENEIYYNVFLPGTLALSIGSWSWYYWLKENYTWSYLLLIPATLIHPMSGFHIFVLLTGTSVVLYLTGQKKPVNKSIIPLVIYLLVITPWLYFILQHFGKGNIPETRFMEIIRFRLAHHFIPSVFPVKNYLIIGALTMLALTMLTRAQKGANVFLWTRIKLVFLIILTGLLLYTLGIEVFKMPVFITTQWFSTTLWLKTFAILSIATYILLRFKPDFLKSADVIVKWLIPVISMTCLFLAIVGGSIFNNREYQFPWSTISSDKEIAIKCQELTSKEALFLVPPDFTPFPYYSKRSNYISFKQMVHKKKVMGVWFQRIKQMYAVDEAGQITNQMLLLKNNWLKKEASFFKQQGSKYGITHVITYKQHQLQLQVVAENTEYLIYKL